LTKLKRLQFVACNNLQSAASMMLEPVHAVQQGCISCFVT